jgi:hypothetical protein
MDLQLAKILAIQNSLFPVQSSPTYVTSVFPRTELAQSHTVMLSKLGVPTRQRPRFLSHC